MAIKTSKAKKMKVSEEVKKAYVQAFNSQEVFGFLKPGSYDDKQLLQALKDKKLYYPTLVSLKLV